MFVADTAGSLITAIALTLVTAAVTLYLLHWVIRSAVSSALRQHHIWLEQWRNLPPGPTGAIGRGPHDCTHLIEGKAHRARQPQDGPRRWEKHHFHLSGCSR